MAPLSIYHDECIADCDEQRKQSDCSKVISEIEIVIMCAGELSALGLFAMTKKENFRIAYGVFSVVPPVINSFGEIGSNF